MRRSSAKYYRTVPVERAIKRAPLNRKRFNHRLSSVLVRGRALVTTFFRLKRPHRDRGRTHRRVVA